VTVTVTEKHLDTNLLRAMREGASALPSDLGKLRGYLRLIGSLLEEKAAELEASWEQACAVAAEIATLQELEASVAERAIAVRAQSLEQVRVKLAIWRALASGCEDGDLRSPQSRLVLSIDADLERLGSRPR
jgi:hypothetical protein